uniref:Tetratricopeptide repeat protein n=1 Tax=uncultured organism TaxID=155900 RepID=A0A8F2ZD18_9ZZZZ|nr:hypothetical protein [uncultured organism]
MFDSGVEQLRDGAFEDAAESFRRAYRLDPRVETMCNLALTYDRWGEHADLALRAYRSCARDDVGGRFRAYAEQRTGEIERELALAATADPDAAAPRDAAAQDDPDDRLPPAPPPREADHTVLYVGLGVAGLALVAMGLGIGFAVESTAIVEDLEDQLGPMPTVVRGSPEHQRLEEAQLYADVATAMYVLMGSMLAASGAMIIVDLAVAGAANEPSLALGPTLGGANLRGRF